jgi:exodeoxyribonuclease VII small subunit
VSDKASKPVDFEQSLADLEALVERMEGGDLALEESLALFERGIRLTRECQGALKEAEQKVQILLNQDGEESLKDFPTDDPDAA